MLGLLKMYRGGFRKQTSGYQRRKGGGGTNEGYGINRYKLLHIKSISSEDLLGSTGVTAITLLNP